MANHPSQKNVAPQSHDVRRADFQVRVLLAIAEACEPMLIRHAEVGSHVEVDKEAEKSASATYSMAQLKLRDILDESARWAATDSSLKEYNEKITASNLDVNTASLKNLEMLRRPSRVYGAKIGRFVDQKTGQGVWLSWMGTEFPIEGGLVGAGMSPEAALDSFDKRFSEQIKDEPLPPASPAEEIKNDPPPSEPPAVKKPRKKK